MPTTTQLNMVPRAGRRCLPSIHGHLPQVCPKCHLIFTLHVSTPFPFPFSYSSISHLFLSPRSLRSSPQSYSQLMVQLLIPRRKLKQSEKNFQKRYFQIYGTLWINNPAPRKDQARTRSHPAHVSVRGASTSSLSDPHVED